MLYRMRYNGLAEPLRVARRRKGLTQSDLAAQSGVSRVTIARLEGASQQELRIGTISRLCGALGLELTAVSRDESSSLEVLLVRERERGHRIDLRRRHAALAARLLQIPRREADGLVRKARGVVDHWEREQICSRHYVSRWRALLKGSRERVSRSLSDPGSWADALFQNSPWSFALVPPAP